MKLPMPMSLSQLAQIIGGRVQGNGDIKVESVAASPLHAGTGDIAFVFDKNLVQRLDECKATAVVLPEGSETTLPAILVERPTLAIQRVLTSLKSKRYLPAQGVHPTAVVDPAAKLGKDVAIGPLVVIGADTVIGDRTVIMAGCIVGGGVKIGDDCLFHPASLIADFVKIGNRVIFQQGASVGSDGFGYVTERPSNLELRMEGRHDLSDQSNPLLKIPQIGTVIIEDDVEIGSYTTIDRATIGATTIGRGTKIDNQVMIAHNVRVGQEALIVSHSGIAGSTSLGDRAVIAGHVAIKDHIKIGKDAIVEGCAGVMRDVEDQQVVVGLPATPKREQFLQQALIRKLPKFSSELKQMQKRIAELEEQLKGDRGKNGAGQRN